MDEERHALSPWDGEPYEVTDWRAAKLHPDHHVACQYGLYRVSRFNPTSAGIQAQIDVS